MQNIVIVNFVPTILRNSKSQFWTHLMIHLKYLIIEGWYVTSTEKSAMFAKIVLRLICLQQRRLLCNNVLGTSNALVCSWRTRHCAQTLQFVQKKVPVQTFLTLCSINEVWVEHKDYNIETPSRRFKQAFKDTVMWAEFFMEFRSGSCRRH